MRATMSFLWGTLVLLAIIPPASAQISFASRHDYFSGLHQSTLLASHLDEDSHVDLVGLHSEQEGFLTVHRGRGDGTFEPAQSIPAPTELARGVLGDVNRDGVLDLVALRWDSPTREVVVVLGTGDSSFFSSSLLTPISLPSDEVILGDFDEDGELDALVRPESRFDDVITLLLGDGSGTFFHHSDIATLDHADMTVADFNRDGHLDFAVVPRNNAGLVQIHSGAGDGTFSFVDHPLPLPLGSTQFETVDLNGDDWSDLVFRTCTDVRVYLNDTVGGFVESIILSPQIGGFRLDFPDLNDDGVPEVFLSRGPRSALFVSQGSLTYSAPIYFASTGGGPVFEDFDENGTLDVATPGRAVVSVSFGDGQGAIGPMLHSIPSDLGGQAYYASPAADWNGDGFPDVVVGSFFGTRNETWLYSGGPDGSLQMNFQFNISASSSPVPGHFNNDDLLDVAISGNVSRVFLNNGAGGFFGGSAFSPNRGVSVDRGDFNEDGCDDLVLAVPHFDQLQVILANSGLELGFEAPEIHAWDAQLVKVADIDGDGHLDIAVLRDPAAPVLLFGDGNAGFPDVVTLPSLPLHGDVVLTDLDGDGLLDVAISGFDSTDFVLGNLTVFRNVDGRSFVESDQHDLPFGPLKLAVLDADGDGIVDLASVNGRSANVSLLRGRGDGTFDPPVLSFVSFRQACMTASDFGAIVVGVFQNSGGHPWRNERTTRRRSVFV